MCVGVCVEICISFEKFITNFSLLHFTISAECYSKSASLRPNWFLNPDKCLPRLRPAVVDDNKNEVEASTPLLGLV